MKRTRRPAKPVSAEAIARMADRGEEVSLFFAGKGRMARPVQRVCLQVSSYDADSTEFLNVDLEIDSKTDLQPLVTALGKGVHVLRCDRYKRTYGARLEVARQAVTAEATIREFCRLIEKLPKPARQHWDTAKVRSFSIGIQAGVVRGTSDFAISPETVRWAAELGAGIVFTVYAGRFGTKRAPVSSRTASRRGR